MLERQATELVSFEMAQSATARPCKGGWSLYMVFATHKRQLPKTVILDRSRGGPRVFKTLEALVACAARIGFREVSIPSGSMAVRPSAPPASSPVPVTREQARRLKQMARKVAA